MKYVVGYGVSVGVGAVVIWWFIEKVLRKKYCEKRGENDCGKPSLVWLPISMGILDRILYTTAWIISQEVFIGVWLAVKVARGWKVPEERKATASSVVRYNVFLIGNALCVIFGVSGGMIINRWDEILTWLSKIF